MADLLTVDKLAMRFGGITAVKELSFTVPEGQIFSLIGPNGAGKTSAFNAITGIYEPSDGTILFQNHEQARPITWRVGMMCALVAIATGLLGMVLLGNVIMLWVNCVNSLYDVDEFTYPRAVQAAWDYQTGHGFILVQNRFAKNEYSVSYPTSKGYQELASFKGTEKDASPSQLPVAKKLISQLSQAIERPSDDLTQKLLDDKEWTITARSFENDDELLKKPGGEITAKTHLFKALNAENKSRHFRQLLGLVLGLCLGGFGYWTMWNRGRRTPDVIGLSGMARTFQNIRLFREMTVIENVMVGLDRMIGGNVLTMALRTPGQVRHERTAQANAVETLAFVGLEHRANRMAGSLPYGEQRRLEIARALATRPKLLLLDEPGAGMNPNETAELMGLIRKIRTTGVTVLLIEHHMNVVMGISDYIVVMDQGQKIAEGTPIDVRNNPKVIEAYLGKEELG